jgi:hypothetical protein
MLLGWASVRECPLSHALVSVRMEVECHAPDEHAVALWIEPWGDRVEVPPGGRLRLMFEGDMVESVVIQWMEEKALSVGVPRYSVLRVVNDAGDVLGEYDTNTLPPVPEGGRPI